MKNKTITIIAIIACALLIFDSFKIMRIQNEIDNLRLNLNNEIDAVSREINSIISSEPPSSNAQKTTEPTTGIEDSIDNTPAVNIATVEDEVAKNGSYCQYIKDEDGIYLVISPDVTVVSFKFVTVQVEETELGLRYSVADELYSIDELTPEKPFLVKMQFVGLLPTYGIVFEDQKNNERFYTINMKGTDVTESYPYYLSEVEFPQDAVLENK